MSQISNLNPKNAVIVNGGFGTFQSYWISFFSQIAKRFNAAGEVAQVTSPNATDLATAITLANELKTKLNALNTALNS